MSSVRVGIIGARAARQGLGPYVARDLKAAGADVVAISTTSEATLEEARGQLSKVGVLSAGFTSVEAMLDAVELDALAILSPAAHHETALDWAWTAGKHVLCEKPLVDPGTGADAGRLVDQFHTSGLLLMENCQWPRVLEGARGAFPGFAPGIPERFEMELSPEASGEGLVRDAMSHPLSLLQALTGSPGALINLVFDETDPATGFTVARFDFLSPDHITACEVRLFRTAVRPRPASFSVDGRKLDRLIREPGYKFSLVLDGQEQPCLDPLTSHVKRWVQRVSDTLSGEQAPRANEVVARADMLDALMGTFRSDT